MKIMLSKALVFVVIISFVFASLSSVYAGLNVTSRTVEIPISLGIEPEIPYPYLEKEELRDRYYKHHPDRHLPPKKPTTFIDGEDWDIVVPDDYPTIQEAINHAEPEDDYRIFVKSGIYNENIVIGIDGIVLHGEDKWDTFIDGSNKRDTISIDCNYLDISGFTIKNSGNNYAGIKIYEASGNLIQDNVILSNSFGVSIIDDSHANTITGNTITTSTRHGVIITDFCSGNEIYDNSISDNTEYGISIDGVSRGNIVTWNTINGNNVGINCSGVSDGNLFHHNGLIDNELNVYDNSDNRWDDRETGNYWSDYTGVDNDGDGIGDTPYLISGGENQDRFPLMTQPQYYQNLYEQTMNTTTNAKYDYESTKPRFSTTFLGDTIIVPDDYPTIQEAVDHADDGDTVFVSNGTYYENVVINKVIDLIGEDRNTTVIDGKHIRDVVSISADGVNIRGFKVEASSGDYLFNAGINVLSNYNTICGNNILYNGCGLRVSSHNNHISGNNIFNNTIGMFLVDSNTKNNIISANKVLANNMFGIYLFSCSNNLVSENIIHNSLFFGIGLSRSFNNTISDNSFVNDGLYVYKSYQNTVSTNMVNGKPLVYFENGIDMVIDEAGQVILIGCENIMIRNQKINDTDIAIQLWDTDNCFILDNNISENLFGTLLYNSSNNTISSNTLSNNEYGISIDSSQKNNISYNTILKNGYGVEVGYAMDNNISDNYISNNRIGMYLDFGSYHNFISNNTIKMNNEYGIYLDYANNNIISNNFILNNSNGIHLTFSSDYNAIYHNNIIGNKQNAYDECTNSWDNGIEGNYWDDYTGTDDDGDGIGDTAYNIPGGDSKDRYPLLKPFGAKLEIEIGKDIFIRNIGWTDAYDVNISVDVTGGIFGRIDAHSENAFDILLVDDETGVELPFMFGFGKVELVVTAIASNAEPVSKTANGFIFLFFYFL